MPLSHDPVRRARSLANLHRGLSSRPAARAAQLANLQKTPPSPPPPGNQRHRTHGAYAAIDEERLSDKETEIFLTIAEDAPIREGDDQCLPAVDTHVVQLLAQTLCRLENVSAYLETKGIVGPTGLRLGALDIELKLRNQAVGYLSELGMTPMARAAIGALLATAAEGGGGTVGTGGRAYRLIPAT